MTTQEITISGTIAELKYHGAKLLVGDKLKYSDSIRTQALVDWLKAHPECKQLEIAGGQFDDTAPFIDYLKDTPALTHIAIQDGANFPDLPQDTNALTEIALTIWRSENPYVREVSLAGIHDKHTQRLSDLCHKNKRRHTDKVTTDAQSNGLASLPPKTVLAEIEHQGPAVAASPAPAMPHVPTEPAKSHLEQIASCGGFPCAGI